MTTTTPQPPPQTQPARGWPGGRVVAAVAITVLAVLLIVHYAGNGDDSRDGHRAEHRADHTPVLAADGQSEARLVISGGTDRLTVTAADLGGDLVRAETPQTQRAVPVLQETAAGTVSVMTRAEDEVGGSGTDLTIRLSQDVRWQIAVDGGSSLLTLDLGQARVQSLDVTQGVSTIEANLPRPDGVLRARVGGGAGTVRVVVPAGVPAQATFAGGAGGANLDGVQHGGLSAGETLTAPERSSHPEVWESPDRIELALDSGIGSLDLSHQD